MFSDVSDGIPVNPRKALKQALVMSKADFVQLSTQFHFNFDRFLTVDRLYELYNKTVHKGRIDCICNELKEGYSVEEIIFFNINY